MAVNSNFQSALEQLLGSMGTADVQALIQQLVEQRGGLDSSGGVANAMLRPTATAGKTPVIPMSQMQRGRGDDGYSDGSSASNENSGNTEADSDGDGVSNDQDSSPGSINSLPGSAQEIANTPEKNTFSLWNGNPPSALDAVSVPGVVAAVAAMSLTANPSLAASAYELASKVGPSYSLDDLADDIAGLTGLDKDAASQAVNDSAANLENNPTGTVSQVANIGIDVTTDTAGGGDGGGEANIGGSIDTYERGPNQNIASAVTGGNTGPFDTDDIGHGNALDMLGEKFGLYDGPYDIGKLLWENQQNVYGIGNEYDQNMSEIEQGWQDFLNWNQSKNDELDQEASTVNSQFTDFAGDTINNWQDLTSGFQNFAEDNIGKQSDLISGNQDWAMGMDDKYNQAQDWYADQVGDTWGNTLAFTLPESMGGSTIDLQNNAAIANMNSIYETGLGGIDAQQSAGSSNFNNLASALQNQMATGTSGFDSMSGAYGDQLSGGSDAAKTILANILGRGDMAQNTAGNWTNQLFGLSNNANSLAANKLSLLQQLNLPLTQAHELDKITLAGEYGQSAGGTGTESPSIGTQIMDFAGSETGGNILEGLATWL